MMAPNDGIVEQQIRRLLAAEADSISLSNKLFGPEGLFGRLASTQAERRTVAQSSLFREAQRRLSELRREDAETFSQLVGQFQQSRDGNAPTIRLGSV